MTISDVRLVSVNLKATASLETMPQPLKTGRLEVARPTSSTLKVPSPLERYNTPNLTPSVKALKPHPVGSLASHHNHKGN